MTIQRCPRCQDILYVEVNWYICGLCKSYSHSVVGNQIIFKCITFNTPSKLSIDIDLVRGTSDVYDRRDWKSIAIINQILPDTISLDRLNKLLNYS